MKGRRPGCGCNASLQKASERPWVIYERRRIGSKVGCLACGAEWRTRDRYVDELKDSRRCVDKRRPRRAMREQKAGRP